VAPGRSAGLLLAGGQDSEYCHDAYFQGRPNGAFTFIALRSLRTLPATATDAHWYRKIHTILPSQQDPQTPNLFGAKGMKAWRVFR
jgi:hypothetical protein